MPYVKTGRPPGRPRTKEYVTLMARVPQEIADQVTRYKAVHRQSTSEVLRDALTMLLEEDRYRPFVPDRNTKQEILSDVIPTPEIPSDTLHQQRLREIVVDMQEDAPWPEIASDTNGVHSVPFATATVAESPSDPEPDDHDALEWLRWVVLDQLRKAEAPLQPKALTAAIAALAPDVDIPWTTDQVSSALTHWCKGKYARHVDGGYIALASHDQAAPVA